MDLKLQTKKLTLSHRYILVFIRRPSSMEISSFLTKLMSRMPIYISLAFVVEILSLLPAAYNNMITQSPSVGPRQILDVVYRVLHCEYFSALQKIICRIALWAWRWNYRLGETKFSQRINNSNCSIMMLMRNQAFKNVISLLETFMVIEIERVIFYYNIFCATRIIVYFS